MALKSTSYRWGVFTYAVLCYTAFQLSFVSLILFLNDIVLPTTVSLGVQRPLGVALAVNVGLITFFAIQHSVMARGSFKRALFKVMPPIMERSTYVLASSICLAMIVFLWSPLEGAIWKVENQTAAVGIYAIQALGWAVLLASSFSIDHFDLFGLRQGWTALHGKDMPKPQFRTPFLYRIVRHPLQLGLFIGIWATPNMTVGHLTLALGFTFYIFVGLWFEERDLIRQFGDRYRVYRQQVPQLFPLPRGRSTKGAESGPGAAE